MVSIQVDMVLFVGSPNGVNADATAICALMMALLLIGN